MNLMSFLISSLAYYVKIYDRFWMIPQAKNASKLHSRILMSALNSDLCRSPVAQQDIEFE